MTFLGCLRKANTDVWGRTNDSFPSMFRSCCGQAADKGHPSITVSHLWVSVPGSVTLLISTMLTQPQWEGAISWPRCRASASLDPLPHDTNRKRPRHAETSTNTHLQAKTRKTTMLLQQNMMRSHYLSQFLSNRGGLFCIQVPYDISAETEDRARLVWFELRLKHHLHIQRVATYLYLYLKIWYQRLGLCMSTSSLGHVCNLFNQDSPTD